jgi:hypothetical protein
MWWFLAVAWAADLQVQVLPDVAGERLARRVPTRAGAVPLTWVAGGLRVDGEWEPEWDRVAPGPELLPLPGAVQVPETSVRVAATPEALVFAVGGLGERATGELLVDADGARRMWWQVSIGEEVTWQRCGLEEVLPAHLPSRAVPCAVVKRPGWAARGPQGWEVAIPWRELPAATSRMRLLWTAKEGRRVGTWAHDGGAAVLPERGIPIRQGQPPGNLSVQVDPRDGSWEVLLSGATAVDWQWRWTRTDFGQPVDEGVLDGVAGDLRWTLPPLVSWGGALTVRAEVDVPVAPGFVVMVGRPASRAQVITPVFGEQIEVAWESAGPVLGLGLSVETLQGELLGQTKVDLPEGHGVLRIAASPRWKDVVVRLEALMPDGMRAARAR